MMAASRDEWLSRLFTTDGHRIEATERWRERISERVGAPATNYPSKRPPRRRAAAADCRTARRDAPSQSRRPYRPTGSASAAASSITRRSTRWSEAGGPFRPRVRSGRIRATPAWRSAPRCMRLRRPRADRALAVPGPVVRAGRNQGDARQLQAALRLGPRGTRRSAGRRTHLQQGRLVGWFDGAMEWGPRALGARSILANPFAPYVLENLNRFLKRREPWRGYALSGLDGRGRRRTSTVPAKRRSWNATTGRATPRASGHVLPSPEAAHVRVHTVGDDGPPRFRTLLEAFGAATGCPSWSTRRSTAFTSRSSAVRATPSACSTGPGSTARSSTDSCITKE